MRVYIDVNDGKVENCEVTGVSGQDARDLVDYLMDRQRPTAVPRPVYPPALPPTYVSVDILREAVGTVYDGSANKIRCIKMVRQLTGWGLKESKDFVETISPRNY